MYYIYTNFNILYFDRTYNFITFNEILHGRKKSVSQWPKSRLANEMTLCFICMQERVDIVFCICKLSYNKCTNMGFITLISTPVFFSTVSIWHLNLFCPAVPSTGAPLIIISQLYDGAKAVSYSTHLFIYFFSDSSHFFIYLFSISYS